jgi:O-antigen/teichoic acid export membrane protein
MTRTRRAISGIVSSYAATVVMAVVGLVLVPIVLRYVSREEYGLWATIGQAVGFLGLLDIGVGSAVSRRTAQLSGYADAPARIRRTLSTALAVYCVLSALFLGIGLPLARFVPRLLAVRPSEAPLAAAIFMLMVVYGAMSLPLHVFVKALYGAQRIAEANGVTLLENVLSPAITVVMLLMGIGLVALPLATIAAGIAAGLLGVVLVRRAVPHLKLAWSDITRAETRELFTWSWLLGLNSFAVLVIYQTDNLVVANGSGLAAATTYSLTSRLPLYAMPLIFALADSCLPGVVELCEQGHVDRVRSVHSSVLRLSVGLAVGVGILSVGFNGPFMRLWVGAQNFGGQYLTLAFALILVYRVVMQTAAMVVIGAGRIRGVVYMSIVEAALNLGLSLFWVRRFGIAGVALATVVAGLSTSAWYVVSVVSDVLRVRIIDYVTRAILLPLLCGIPAAGLAATIRSTTSIGSWIDLVWAGGITAIVYAGTFVWIGLAPTDRRQLWQRLQESGLMGARVVRREAESPVRLKPDATY